VSPSPPEHPCARAALLPAVEIVTALETFKDSDPEQFWGQLETGLAGSPATGPGEDDSYGDRATVLQQIAARAVDPARATTEPGSPDDMPPAHPHPCRCGRAGAGMSTRPNGSAASGTSHRQPTAVGSQKVPHLRRERRPSAPRHRSTLDHPGRCCDHLLSPSSPGTARANKPLQTPGNCGSCAGMVWGS